MKKNLLILVVLFALFFGANAIIHATSDDKFCSSCHEWMDTFVSTYHKDTHGGANKNGVKASCVSCHLPHDSYVKYVFTKAKNGVSEVAVMLTSKAENANWQENRKNRENFVYDSGCLDCHKTILDINQTNKNIDDMHAIYVKFKDDKTQKLSCVSCHKNVGHKELGKVLYEIKNPPVGNW